MKPLKLSKSRYIQGLQCTKALWLKIHEPDAPELKPDPVAKHRFEVGHRLGELAQKQYPEGVLVENLSDFESWLQDTADQVDQETSAIFEAAFSDGGLFAAIDILVKKDEGWEIIEVKSSLSVKEHHLQDLAFQWHVLQKQGIKVKSAKLMHINRDYRIDECEASLFTQADVTAEVVDLLPTIKANIDELIKAIDDGIPPVKPGVHCKKPYGCSFYERCNKRRDLNHLSNLYRMGSIRAMEAMRDGEAEDIRELSMTFNLSEIQMRQKEALVKNECIVLSDELQKDLGKIRYPIAFLDFETIMPAMPIWKETAPYQSVPVQMSCHLISKDGGVQHHEAIYANEDICWDSFCTSIIEACEDAGTIVAYNAKFEISCMSFLASMSPKYSDRMLELTDKFVDLLPIVRNHVYHPEFNGSFSIKSVFPALVDSNVGYDSLDISNGMLASTKLERSIIGLEELMPGEIQDLKEYCKLDTYAMVLLLEKLRHLTTA